MKIAIPVENGLLCPHFGHCQTFTIFEVDEQSGQIQRSETVTPPPHEPGVLPEWLRQNGCTHIVAGGMGGRAQALFQQHGIAVVCGAPAWKPEDIVKALLNNTLTSSDNPCDGPEFHRHSGGKCGRH